MGTACRPMTKGDCMDEDLEALTKEQLMTEVKRLRAGIRSHRDSTGHDLCWHHPALWGLLPEQSDLRPWVPTWPKFMEGCIRYRTMLDRELADAPRRDLSYSDVPSPTKPGGGLGGGDT
jgi:hypothetical protein